ncbi:hypothetical protein [Alkalinema sp. FACHB-956]|uniref:hypothetical protein n=1 Tax=Alkalinema sp. FACHB-956 TaxID=2692768 RepID=UPI001686860A|nr:hypothetical protein [Alkalinema sp. FACHB-956]MBD2326723.1 hypothetical protein [Alkalinema sp. FACHB-956]
MIDFVPPSAFMDWLIEQTPTILNWVDPYSDRRLDSHAQQAVLQLLQALRQEVEEEICQHYRTRTKLPQDPAIRQTVLNQLVTQTLEKQPHWQWLQALESILLLALSENLSVDCIGD